MSIKNLISDSNTLKDISNGCVCGFIYPSNLFDIGDVFIVHGKQYKIINVFIAPKELHQLDGIIKYAQESDNDELIMHLFAYCGPDSYKLEKTGSITIEAEETKTCRICGETKPISEFRHYKDNKYPSKLYVRRECKTCEYKIYKSNCVKVIANDTNLNKK